jgi:hypothetical protein
VKHPSEDDGCKVIEAAQRHMRDRYGDTITREDVSKAQAETGLTLPITNKKKK